MSSRGGKEVSACALVCLDRSTDRSTAGPSQSSHAPHCNLHRWCIPMASTRTRAAWRWPRPKATPSTTARCVVASVRMCVCHPTSPPDSAASSTYPRNTAIPPLDARGGGRGGHRRDALLHLPARARRRRYVRIRPHTHVCALPDLHPHTRIHTHDETGDQAGFSPRCLRVFNTKRRASLFDLGFVSKILAVKMNRCGAVEPITMTCV